LVKPDWKIPSSCKSSTTLGNLEGYKDLIQTATDDLEARLETIDEKLEALVTRNATTSETTELQRIKDERSSTQNCLQICAQLSKHIDQLQPISTDSTSRNAYDIPEKITSYGIQECRVSMEQTTARLEKHMQGILDQMISKSSATMTQEDASYLARLREELAVARQCRDICSRADQHLKDNISVIDNEATGDEAVQFLVSNDQKTIHGKNRGYGDKIKQLGGHLSDQSIQKLSGDFLQMVSIQTPGSRDPAAQSDSSLSNKDMNESRTSWQPQYGSGRALKSELNPKFTTRETSGGAESGNS
jgi:transposase-like protein